jgi:hypothetical protein
MAYPEEKAANNTIITEGSDLPVVLKSEFLENVAPVYQPSKKTWKSYFWSSEISLSSRQTGELSLTDHSPRRPKRRSPFSYQTRFDAHLRVGSWCYVPLS